MTGRPPVDERAQLGLLATAIEHVEAGVEITDPEHRYIYVNPAFEQMTGYPLDRILGRTPAEVLRGDHHDEQFFSEMQMVLARGETWSGRVISRVADGSERPFDVVVSPIVDDDGVMRHHVAVRRDIASQEELHAKMVESDRLATVGQLAAGVAHEINNPLAYVLANIDYVRELLGGLGGAAPRDALSEIEGALSDIEHGAVRIRDIVRDLGAFSATAEGVSGPVDVRALLESTVRLLVNELKHRATVVKDFHDVPLTWSDRSRLGQVFLNVLLNALQAIPVGRAGDNEIRISTRTSSSGWAEVEIADTGSGIPGEVLPRIFDPFFTTRTVGEGTGLGLAVAHRIVVSNGGTLEVESTDGEGTRVSIALPPSTHVAETMLRERVAAPSERARVLAVDDEPAVLRAIARMLPGCDVVTCTDGAEALARLADGAFDAVLCDLMMPRLSGMDLYEQAVAARPELADAFVFITGGAFTPGASGFLAAADRRSIEKPFSADELRSMIVEVVGARGAR